MEYSSPQLLVLSFRGRLRLRSIILNTKFIIFNTNSIIVNTKSIILNTNSILFNEKQIILMQSHHLEQLILGLNTEAQLAHNLLLR